MWVEHNSLRVSRQLSSAATGVNSAEDYLEQITNKGIYSLYIAIGLLFGDFLCFRTILMATRSMALDDIATY